MLDRLNWKTESNADYKRRIKILTQIHRPKKAKTTLPKELLDKHPDLSEKVIKMIHKAVLYSYSRRLSKAYILDVTIPHLGVIWTHRTRVKKYKKRTKLADKKRKRMEQLKKEFSKEYLLY